MQQGKNFVLLFVICSNVGYLMEVAFFFAYGFKYFRVGEMMKRLNHMDTHDEKCVKWFFRGIQVGFVLAYLLFIPLQYLYILGDPSPTIKVLYWCFVWIQPLFCYGNALLLAVAVNSIYKSFKKQPNVRPNEIYMIITIILILLQCLTRSMSVIY